MKLFPQLKIAQKLPLVLVGSALLVGAGVGLSSYLIGLGTVQNQRNQSMQASLNTAVSLVGDYYTSAEVDLRLFVQRSDTVSAMKNLTRALDELRMGSRSAPPRSCKPPMSPTVPIPRTGPPSIAWAPWAPAMIRYTSAIIPASAR